MILANLGSDIKATNANAGPKHSELNSLYGNLSDRIPCVSTTAGALNSFHYPWRRNGATDVVNNAVTLTGTDFTLNSSTYIQMSMLSNAAFDAEITITPSWTVIPLNSLAATVPGVTSEPVSTAAYQDIVAMFPTGIAPKLKTGATLIAEGQAVYNKLPPYAKTFIGGLAKKAMGGIGSMLTSIFSPSPKMAARLMTYNPDQLPHLTRLPIPIELKAFFHLFSELHCYFDKDGILVTRHPLLGDLTGKVSLDMEAMVQALKVYHRRIRGSEQLLLPPCEEKKSCPDESPLTPLTKWVIEDPVDVDELPPGRPTLERSSREPSWGASSTVEQSQRSKSLDPKKRT
jgi:hypothetical protein